MLGLGCMVGVILAFFGALENRFAGFLSLGAAILIQNTFTIGLVIGFMCSSGVLSKIEGTNLHWRTKVDLYSTGVLISSTITALFLYLITGFYSSITVLQCIIIFKILAWIYELWCHKEKITLFNVAGIVMVVGLAWFGIHNAIPTVAFIYFSAMRMNMQYDVKKVINKQNTEQDKQFVTALHWKNSNVWEVILMILIGGVLGINISLDDEDDTSGYDALYQGYTAGAQFALIGLVASQRDLLNTILGMKLTGDSTILFVGLCVAIVFITKLLLEDWFITIYEKLGNLKVLTIINYFSLAFSILTMIYISPYGLMYCLMGIFICNLCSQYVKRISLVALPAFGILG